MITHNFEPSASYILTEFECSFELPAFLASEEALQGDTRYHPSFSRIFDFDGIALDIRTTELIEAVRETKTLPIPDESPIALVAANPASRELLGLFAAHFKEQPIRVFRSRPEAIAWAVQQDPLHLAADGIRIVSLTGSITVDDILRRQLTLYASDDFNPEEPVIWDLRRATSGETLSDSSDRIRYASQTARMAARQGRSAILASSHFMQILIRQVVAATGDWPSDIRLFDDVEEAVTWLREGSR